MRFFDRIQNRTALFFCAASLVPLSLLATLLYRDVTDSLERSASQLNGALVQSVQADIENRLVALKSQIEVLSHLPAMQSLQRKQQDPIIRTFLRYNPAFFKVMTFDNDSKLTSVLWRSLYRGEERLIGKSVTAIDVALGKALNQALEDGKTAGSKPKVDEYSQSTIYFVSPIYHFVHDERVVGAVAAGLHLISSEVQELLERAHLPQGSYACIVDDSGLILARRGPGLPEEVGHHLYSMVNNQKTIDYLNTEEQYVEGHIWVDDEQMFAAAATLPSVGLRLIVAQPWHLVSARAWAVASRIITFTVLGLVFSVVLAVILTRSFVKPLRALVGGIRRVREGQLNHRITVEREDELGIAARVFNDMAAEFEKRQLIEELWSEQWQEEQ